MFQPVPHWVSVLASGEIYSASPVVRIMFGVAPHLLPANFRNKLFHVWTFTFVLSFFCHICVINGSCHLSFSSKMIDHESFVSVSPIITVSSLNGSVVKDFSYFFFILLVSTIIPHTYHPLQPGGICNLEIF